jgi:hypothetical protein
MKISKFFFSRKLSNRLIISKESRRMKGKLIELISHRVWGYVSFIAKFSIYTMTTTMLESFDTQMLDYQSDLDFSMHITSTDSWFQNEAEAVMEDDGHSQHIHNIEIDMEPYGDDDCEYEMEDSSKYHELESTQSSDLGLDHAALSVVQKTDADTGNSPNSIHASLDLAESSTSDSDPHLPYPESSDFSQSPHTFLISDVISSNISPTKEALPISSLQHADVASAGGYSNSPPFDPETSHIEVTSEPDSGIEAVQRYLDHHAADKGEGVGENSETISGAGGIEVSQFDGGPVSSENPPDLYQPVEAPTEYGGSPGDPHEISEGVYIDPPPAVLLSFPSTNHPEISLFNTPSATLVTGDPHTSFAVLLAHLPTLYYEPITSVFEALRQEEHLAAILELLDGELAFDAYDLQLTVHEVIHPFFPSFSSLTVVNFIRIASMHVKYLCMT